MSWTKEQLLKAVTNSKSYAETLRKLGIAVSGPTHKTIKKHILAFKIDTSHFTRIGIKPPRLSLNDILNNGVITSSLRRVILRENVFLYVCVECGVGNNYNGKPLSLHLDHKSGDKTDCRKENLRWLCPNCHSQTPTYSRAKTCPSIIKPRKKLAIRIQLECTNCKNSFYRLESKVNDPYCSGNKFCSNKCKYAYQHKKYGRSKDWTHGTVSGYVKCPKPRCRLCLDAMATYKRQRRQKKLTMS